MEPTSSAPPSIILVDGTCLFCNRLVAHILRRDREGRFHFAHIQSEFASDALARHGAIADIDTIYLIDRRDPANERLLEDGAAGRVIWPQLYAIAFVLRILPLPLLNLFYRLFARFRYRLFGQAGACVVPDQEQRSRFISGALAASEASTAHAEGAPAER